MYVSVTIKMHFQVQDDWDIPTTEELPREKLVLASLSNLYLIGVLTSARILQNLNIWIKAVFVAARGTGPVSGTLRPRPDQEQLSCHQGEWEGGRNWLEDLNWSEQNTDHA